MTPQATSGFGDDPRRRISQRPFSERRRGSVLVGQRSIDILAASRPEQPDAGPRFVKFIIRQYRRYGYFISDHDWQAMLICLIISGLGLLVVITTPQQNDITGYSPYGARARDEYARYQDFFAHNGLGITVYLYALAKDDGSMLRDDYLKESLHVLDDIMENVTFHDAGRNKSMNFQEFCMSFCSINEPVRQFYNGFHIQDSLIKKGKQPNDRLLLNYPIASLFGRTVTLQQNFFGIELYDNGDNTTELLKSAFREDEPIDESSELTNGSAVVRSTRSQFADPRITNMKMVKMIVFQLRAEHNEGWSDKDVKKYEMDIVHRLEKRTSERLNLFVLSQTYVEEEMVRAGISLLPYLTVGFFIMCTCSVVSVLTRAIYLNQHSLPKLFLAVTACVLPFMSCATALGGMFLCGVRFASILCVIPFLVLAIGVDSSYLMIHEWQRVTKHCRDTPNRKNSKVGYRVSEVLSEVGPAILISTLTNIFADGVGSFTSSPEITLLCAGNLASMAVMYIYQMTFYAGLFSLVGRYEIKGEKQERQEFEASLRVPKNEPLAIRRQKLTRQSSKFHDKTKHYTSATIERYVSIVAKKTVAVAIVIAYFTYLAVSIWGITRININLTMQKLFAADSPLLELDKLRVEYQVPHFTMASVFVNNPGNLSIPARMKRMNQFVGDMEALKGSWGPVGTQYFVRDFITFEKSFEGDAGAEEEPADADTPTTTPNPASVYKEEDLPTFIEWPEYSYWAGFIRLDNSTDHLQRFFFTTAYHGKHLSIWTERGKLLNTWRSIVDKYAPEFDASVFHEDGVFLDLIENMPTDTWQSVLGTLLCMGAVCFVFLNSFFTVIMASGCVLSICTGILGILSWWGVDLDPITMAAMIISIGCSVDIPAHVSYHYYQAGARETDSSSEDKLANCLSSVAFPALQAALSTILCVCSLLFVKLYMSFVFVKTMFLCVVLCNLHGLVFLPAFLILFDSVLGHFKRAAAKARRKKVRAERDHQLEEKRRQASPAPVPKEEGKNGNVAHNDQVPNV